jgi:hypothetical protein
MIPRPERPECQPLLRVTLEVGSSSCAQRPECRFELTGFDIERGERRDLKREGRAPCRSLAA